MTPHPTSIGLPRSLLLRPRTRHSARTAVVLGTSALAGLTQYVLVHRGVTAALALALLPPLVWFGTKSLGGLSIGLAMVLVLPSWLTIGAAQASIGRLASLAAASSLLVQRRVPLKLHVVDCALGVYVAVVVLGWLLQYDVPHSGRVVSDELTPIGFYIGARAVPRVRLRHIMLIVLFAGTIGALTVLYEGFYGQPIFSSPTRYQWYVPGLLFRPGGIFGSPPAASTALCFAILFGFGGLPNLRGRFRALVITCIVICAAGLIVTFTRAPMIGIGVAFVVFLWLTRSRLLRPMRVLWFAVVLGVVLLVVLPRLEATSTFQQGIVRPGNLTARESYWSIALPILTASPHNFIFGIGTATLETPGLSVGALTPAAVALRPQTFSNSLHSEYVTILVEQGLVGLAAAAFFLLSAFLPVARIARQAADPQCAALAAALVAVAIVMAVDTVFLDPASFSLIMLATGLAAAVSSQRAADRSPLPTSAHAGIRAHAA